MQFEVRFFRKTSEGFDIKLIEAVCPTEAYNIAARMAKENWSDHYNVAISNGDPSEYEPFDPRKRRMQVP